MAQGRILLYYKYVDIDNPTEIQKWQKELCAQLDLKGRIILAHEGINGTVGGSHEATQAYIAAMNAHPLFGDIDFKESPGEASDFPKLRVLIKNEIVHLGLDPKEITVKDGGTHLSPQEAHALLDAQPDELVVIDCRNAYETKIGTFPGALRPPTRFFREFPAYVDKHVDDLKDKKVLMACTGGIRCERASAYVKAKGIKEVYQIKGGIHRYIEKFPDGHFRGKNYVFDDRIAVRVNDDVISNCELCSVACDDSTNCANPLCNKQYVACANCLKQYRHACSENCATLIAEQKVNARTEYRAGSNQS